MATATRDLTVSKWSYVQEQYKTTHVTPNTTTWYAMASTYGSFDCSMLFAISAFPDSLKHNKLIGAQFRLQVKNGSIQNLSFLIKRLSSDFNSSSVTWNTMPADVRTIFHGFAPESASGDIWLGTGSNASAALDVLTAPSLKIVRLGVEPERTAIKTILSGGGTPYARIYYDDAVKVTSKIQYKSGPTSGYSNPRGATSFSWDYVKNGSDYCAVESWAQSSATFYWKTSGAGSYTAVSISGNTKGVTIPANTFPVNSTIQWYVLGVDEDNTATQTPVYSFSTAAGAASANCVDPVNQVIDGSATYTFNWTISSTDGQAASRTILQWKRTTDSTWTTLVDQNYQMTSFSVPGGTFPAGSIDWKVIPYNIDGVIGTAATASFISVAAPAAVQGLSATAVPYSTVSWQSSEQRAYRVLVDGVEVVKAFGEAVYSYQLTEPLSDGDHNITVMVQGQYGYWSQPSTVEVTIENVPGDEVILRASEAVDVTLLWQTESQTADYYVYRDGKQIAHTYDVLFDDRLAAGKHLYYVINKLSGGYYTKSNEIEATTCFSGARIALLSGGSWMDITITEQSATEQRYSYKRQYSLHHVSGAVYPVLEMSPFEDYSGSYNCAFNCPDDVLAFEKFRGQTVILKSRGSKIIIGAITAIDSHYGDFLAGYTFSIQQIHVEDYIDDTDG